MSTETYRQRLLGRFREVTADRVEKLCGALAAIAEGGGEEELRELARELHTLKGEARMMGFVELSSIVHSIEERVEELGELLPRGAQTLSEAIELLPSLLEDPAPEELPQRIARIVAAPVPDDPGEEGAVAAGGEDLAAARSARQLAASLGAGGEQQSSSIRVDLHSLDAIAGLAGDVLVEGAKARSRADELRDLLEAWPVLAERLMAIAEERTYGAPRGHNGIPDAGALHGASSVGSLMPTLDRASMELHQLRTRTFRFFHHHSESLDGTRQLVSALAEQVAAARLLPLEGVFVGLVEAAALLGEEQGKRLACSVSGGDAGIDRAILPSLRDPLVHLLRNCIAHGLESPEARVAAGKDPVGRIEIDAGLDGDRLRVVVADDGKGIDPALIREAALRRGIVDQAEAAQLSERATIDLIFAPGFSTLERTDELSGRGVGLDVVRERVISFGGSVEVESQLGRGTRFVLTLPQSLSLMKVLLVRIDEDVYGIPASSVEAVGRIEPSEVEEIAGIRTIHHRGRSLPIVALGPLLALNGGPSGGRPLAAFLRVGEQGIALVVDGIIGQREVAVKAPGAFLQGMRFVSGGAALEDGRIALLLSTAELIDAARAQGIPAASTARRRLRVLLVDDSLIAREAEAALLRSLGHEVSEAADGEEGWQKLKAGSFELLVTDIQMPILDGIELTRRVKSDPTTAALPVIIVSSLSSPTDRRRGSEAGADAFLGKSELDGSALADAIERLCGVGG